jgi:hypothetical protein
MISHCGAVTKLAGGLSITPGFLQPQRLESEKLAPHDAIDTEAQEWNLKSRRRVPTGA